MEWLDRYIEVHISGQGGRKGAEGGLDQTNGVEDGGYNTGRSLAFNIHGSMNMHVIHVIHELHPGEGLGCIQCLLDFSSSAPEGLNLAVSLFR